VDDLRFRDSAEITAHRGSSLKAPENTLAAVRQAIRDGATHVEVDVQRTADGRVVVNHDADLMRVAGVPLVISKSNFADLRSIELGKDHGDAFPGQRIPTLEEVLEVTGGRATLIVELKSYRADSSQLIADVVRILREHRDRADAVIMSLNHAEVREVKRIAPEIESGFVASATMGDITRLEADFLAVSKRQATAVFVGAAHAEEKEVYVWTVDDPKEMSRMVDRGADNLITNDPATAVRVLEMRSELDNTQRMLLRFRNLYVD
jgi:glycerophosphoryl diester phosphodiesterase